MMSNKDFVQKQIIFIFSAQKEKLSFLNDNIIVKDEENKIKFQTSCYRIFAVFVIGHISITSALIQKSKKFGFSIVLMTTTTKVYESFCCETRGNTLLREKQYKYAGYDIGRYIAVCKIKNQIFALKKVHKDYSLLKSEIIKLEGYIYKLFNSDLQTQSIMGFEGSASRLYFQYVFTNVAWNGRRPRVKDNMINAVLDIGYTLIFNFIEALLNLYGFDLYVGVLHKQFYMRKSLVCDLVEPLRPLVDITVNKAIGLKQFKESDFIIINNRYLLKYENNSKYIKTLMEPILEYKEKIFLYIQNYYRSFMKGKSGEQFIMLIMEDLYGNN